MSNPSKRKGTAHESAVLKYLRERGLETERLALSGSQDEGDLLLRAGTYLAPTARNAYDLRDKLFVLEAKATKAFTPAEWIKQAKVEAANYATHRGVEVPHFAVVAKARQKPVSEAYVITTLAEWLRQIDG